MTFRMSGSNDSELFSFRPFDLGLDCRLHYIWFRSNFTNTSRVFNWREKRYPKNFSRLKLSRENALSFNIHFKSELSSISNPNHPEKFIFIFYYRKSQEERLKEFDWCFPYKGTRIHFVMAFESNVCKRENIDRICHILCLPLPHQRNYIKSIVCLFTIIKVCWSVKLLRTSTESSWKHFNDTWTTTDESSLLVE